MIILILGCTEPHSLIFGHAISKCILIINSMTDATLMMHLLFSGCNNLYHVMFWNPYSSQYKIAIVLHMKQNVFALCFTLFKYEQLSFFICMCFEVVLACLRQNMKTTKTHIFINTFLCFELIAYGIWTAFVFLEHFSKRGIILSRVVLMH